jgi:cation diffusion facilitator family transporter
VNEHAGTAGEWVSHRTLARSRERARASRRTVLIALLSNAAVAAAKAAGGLISGSPALLAEAAHSVADTTNQGFLLLSIALANREPTPDQPFGYARSRFLWTFIAAVAMFLAGAVFAVGIGVRDALKHSAVEAGLATYVPLAVSLVAEGGSLLRALSQTRQEAAEAGLGLVTYARQSRDPNVKMVLFEDTAAVIGIAIALAGIVIGQVTGSPLPDPIASIAVGLLLIAVAVWMGHDVSELLIGAAARPRERERIARALEEFDEIDQVLEVLTMVLGPNSLLVAARVDFARGLDDAHVERASERVDRRLREVVPDVTEVFLDATTAPRSSDATARRRR